MPALISVNITDGAPGATVTIPGAGLTGGAGAKVELLQQGADGSLTTEIAAPTFASDGTSVAFAVPDGALSGPVRVTASDASTAQTALAVNSQYLFASQYVGEGTEDEVAGMPAGTLDRILQRASQYADSYLSQGTREAMTLRYLQTSEKHRWRRTRRIYPWRTPIASIDAFVYIASPAVQATFDPASTLVINEDADYVEMVVWSVGYSYIQALASQTMADAGIVKITYTAGYPYAKYPQTLREAVTMIATELINQRKINKSGLGALDSVRQGYVQYNRRSDPFEVPAPAKVLLDSFRPVRPS